MNTLDEIKKLQQRINESIIGQADVVQKILVVFLADGNLLLEGLPGLAKTRAIKSLSKELKASLSRIQFTPDLLPSDITGTEIFQPELENPFVFKQGPIFANLVLADEINRAPAKVQAALLEAMEERQVTVAGKTYQMEDLFLVMATQNPVEQEGTYPLPEAQMDRFLMKILMDYPDSESEEKILELVSAESRGEFVSNEPISQDVIFKAREEIRQIEVSKATRKYIVDLINATRNAHKYSDNLKTWIDYGASPRGTIALEKCARVIAWFHQRNYVEPDDVREIIHEVLRHRLILSYEANAQRISADQVIDELLKSVAVL
ncbi:MoxR family ATPase [Carboxylicivirga sp. M1479]|uniref:AAA family ATPase n=1 Tax=Carboxylicivirga sp. M1479 TaxID=2594476 RepID=UPI00117754A1|nr:MoxR family ATPase [Carboxylicivirga sp. M1479]TRX72121.1 MoxR family ATPase [Carboxylicivirga sp. M1479]